MPIPFGLLVVVVLVLFQLIALVHCLQALVVFAVNRQVVRDVLSAYDAVELHLSAGE